MLLTPWNHHRMKTADRSPVGPRWGSSVVDVPRHRLLGGPSLGGSAGGPLIRHRLSLRSPSREFPPPAVEREQAPRGRPKLSEWADEKDLPKHTTKTQNKTTKLGIDSSWWRWTRKGCVQKAKENSFQKGWSRIFNAGQQPRKGRADHCPSVIGEFNKESSPGSSESRSQTLVGRKVTERQREEIQQQKGGRGPSQG